jgi:hypothetical protein
VLPANGFVFDHAQLDAAFAAMFARGAHTATS